MQRIYGYVHMFIKKDHSGILDTTHIQQGTWYLLRMVQRVNFSSEYKDLKRSVPISTSSKLASLSPFLDSFGLIRVGGRLENALLDYHSRHPIILPKGHPLTESIITHFHHQNLHAGPQALLAAIRQQYWPLGGKKVVSHIISKCVRCFRLRPKICEQIMGNLPEDRVRQSRAFLITGVDYCGPFYYRSEIRSRPSTKCYISLFICFTTKAVHMEVVKDLSTESFLAALRRFYCTRGKPKVIWSDNATNFVGARNEMAELQQQFLKQQHVEAVYRQCLVEGIDWKFIPPRSPHFGGLWEASIKIAKFYFWRIVGSAVPTFDELRTLVCQISAVINSRPLCPITENPDDLDVLTPGHFLIGAPLTSIPEPNLSTINTSRLSNWQRIQFMQQTFWKRWSSEYLSLLQQRSRWRYPRNNLPIGTLVLIKDEALPPLKWLLGRVTKVFLGNDSKVRVAEVKTANGICKRAISKLCALPIDDHLAGGMTRHRGEYVQSTQSAT
ncbi:uncharacterized protein LOC126766136 [Bactrocera neohumeralis]|uniref:uncharacterized protein LOC126766136 n=1 Tax=Bactrocera neohumeralis TaxID=98809 RepID=UPI002166B599|nr:uncharacterized protein LOC126766136 [Bactrocera neohumeralis]